MAHASRTPPRNAAEIGRSIMKTVSDLSKILPEDAHDQPVQQSVQQPAQIAVPVMTPAPANDAMMISRGVEMSGLIVAQDRLHIAGRIEGGVRAAAVTVCASGVVRGDIVADCVIVQGSVEGRIYGAMVQLAATAKVRGDIFHSTLEIDADARFEGASRRLADVMAEAPMFATSTEAA